MGMSDGQKIVFAVGAFTIATAAYFVAVQSGHEAKSPKFEGERSDPFQGLNSQILLTMHSGSNQCEGHEWRRHDFDPTNESCVFLPVRYPKLSGSTVSSVVHHGWSALNKPAASDGDWVERPPAEVDW